LLSFETFDLILEVKYPEEYPWCKESEHAAISAKLARCFGSSAFKNRQKVSAYYLAVAFCDLSAASRDTTRSNELAFKHNVPFFFFSKDSTIFPGKKARCFTKHLGHAYITLNRKEFFVNKKTRKKTALARSRHYYAEMRRSIQDTFSGPPFFLGIKGSRIFTEACMKIIKRNRRRAIKSGYISD
jgi:hypothetical protein